MILNFRAMRWCWDNGVKFSPFPVVSNGSVLKIIQSKNGNETLGTEQYTPDNIYKKINELYTAIYERNNQDV
ncbi:hypothetical protein CXF68_20285 [Tenacibaculum sp. Bg11-29]|uniref:hypothetical protein n=1 Tax=Tenacibaculum sp. Bg11-29 TaxID=2058306 RepID=UPI000C3366D8|nr:hypothetical protein [Tenacibaculum sp. Bg11-29]PKH52893.1 hypothetical protein CXF68_20285 [Tenacibaculum sp. Bg11-29]